MFHAKGRIHSRAIAAPWLSTDRVFAYIFQASLNHSWSKHQLNISFIIFIFGKDEDIFSGVMTGELEQSWLAADQTQAEPGRSTEFFTELW